ncbi:DUF6506 family protein [Litorivita pollutaquae]|uniref:DUF6506 family protein n=1 Tax=Litorivita pollutaquae TaxID=2200892 RepID=UPI0038B2C32D
MRWCGTIAGDLAVHGCAAVELCAGFARTNIGRIFRAVDGKATVGAARFDTPPPWRQKRCQGRSGHGFCP